MNGVDSDKAARPRPPWLRALGRDEPPFWVMVEGRLYTRTTIFKHDAWAATALYEGEGGKIICKFGRAAPLLGFPMRWLGRFLAGHESRVMRRLADVELVPKECGPLEVNGVVWPHAMARRFVEGRTLLGDKKQDGRFFQLLEELLRQVHARRVAYVDFNKPDNILIGDDGRPYLIDFQISFALCDRWPGNSAPMRWLLRLLQDGDWYHFGKHVRRYQAEGGTVAIPPLPWFIRLHRLIAVPFRQSRRWLLVKLRVRGGTGQADTEQSQKYMRPEE